MNYYDLIMDGRAHLAQCPAFEPMKEPTAVFAKGGRWMYARLNELRGREAAGEGRAINFTLYGCLKYGVSLAGATATAWWALVYCPWLLPLSGLVFYLLEAPFLFLFPLLIDRAPRPVLTGLRLVWRIGLLKCLGIVIPISLYMIAGLFRKRDRIRNWYVGCMAIIIWYQHEASHRLSRLF